jgi:hypothetical protein
MVPLQLSYNEYNECRHHTEFGVLVNHRLNHEQRGKNVSTMALSHVYDIRHRLWSLAVLGSPRPAFGYDWREV